MIYLQDRQLSIAQLQQFLMMNHLMCAVLNKLGSDIDSEEKQEKDSEMMKINLLQLQHKNTTDFHHSSGISLFIIRKSFHDDQ